MAISVFVALNVAALALSATKRTHESRLSVPATAISLVAAVLLLVLSHLEHTRSIRPSSLITIYLLTTILCDAARLRTKWLLGESRPDLSVITACLAVKVAILALEAVGKRKILLDLYQYVSLEATSGLVNRSAFFWLNSLLLTGFRTVLSQEDLPAIHEKLDSSRVSDNLNFTWSTC